MADRRYGELDMAYKAFRNNHQGLVVQPSSHKTKPQGSHATAPARVPDKVKARLRTVADSGNSSAKARRTSSVPPPVITPTDRLRREHVGTKRLAAMDAGYVLK